MTPYRQSNLNLKPTSTLTTLPHKRGVTTFGKTINKVVVLKHKSFISQ